jgi:hypothetical protein
MMNTQLKIEHALLFILGLYAFELLDISWWWFWGLILVPDVSMVGYLAGPRVGAISYNVAHNLATAIIVAAVGWYVGLFALEVAGVILFIHSNMDRILGYGLKFPDDFKHTHLGWIGGGDPA